MLSICCVAVQHWLAKEFSGEQFTYTEVLQVIDAEGVAEKVEESILEHASVTVAALGVSDIIASGPTVIRAQQQNSVV